MTKKLDLYRCNLCGNIVEIKHEGIGTLVCCNQNMELLEANIATEENPHFAHVEVLENNDKKITFNHVAEEAHHIEFIEALSPDGKYSKVKFLGAKETPEMILKCNCKDGFYTRIYCNKDGMWVTE